MVDDQYNDNSEIDSASALHTAKKSQSAVKLHKSINSSTAENNSFQLGQQADTVHNTLHEENNSFQLGQQARITTDTSITGTQLSQRFMLGQQTGKLDVNCTHALIVQEVNARLNDILQLPKRKGRSIGTEESANEFSRPALSSKRTISSTANECDKFSLSIESSQIVQRALEEQLLRSEVALSRSHRRSGFCRFNATSATQYEIDSMAARSLSNIIRDQKMYIAAAARFVRGELEADTRPNKSLHVSDFVAFSMVTLISIYWFPLLIMGSCPNGMKLLINLS